MNSDILNHIHAPAQPNMGLANGLKCVQLLAASPRPLGSQEIARTLGMKPTRINRMLGTLVAVGMATKTRNRKYLPGPGIHVLSAMSLSNCGILNSAFPVIEELKNRVQGYIALGVLWRTMVWYLYYGNHERSAVEAIGGFAPYDAEISSLGQILLAQQSDELIREVYGELGYPLSSSIFDATAYPITPYLYQRNTVKNGCNTFIANRLHFFDLTQGDTPITGNMSLPPSTASRHFSTTSPKPANRGTRSTTCRHSLLRSAIRRSRPWPLRRIPTRT